MRKALVSAVLLITFAATFVVAEEPTILKPKWEVGKRYIYRDRTITDQTMELPTGPMAQQMMQTQKFAISVLREKEDGGLEVELEFLSISMTMKMGEMEMGYDSEDEMQNDSSPFAQGFKHYPGTKFLLHLNSEGRVEKVDGVNEFLEKLTSGNPATAAQMSDMFTEENFRQMYDNLFTQGLPENPVSIGDTWVLDNQYPMGPSKVDVNVEFTFKGWAEKEGYNCADISFDGKVAGDIEGITSVAGVGMRIREGTVGGRKYFAPDIGQVVSMLNRSEVKMDMTLPMQDGESTATMDQKQSVVMLRVEDIPAAEPVKEQSEEPATEE